MNTLNQNITCRFFRSPEDYDRLCKLWSARMQDKDARRQLTAAHHLLYLVLRGRNWKAAFAPVTNERKLANGGLYNWGARKAIHALHYGDSTRLLAPFGDVLSPDALVHIRALVSDHQWSDHPAPKEAYCG